MESVLSFFHEATILCPTIFQRLRKAFQRFFVADRYVVVSKKKPVNSESDRPRAKRNCEIIPCTVKKKVYIVKYIRVSGESESYLPLVVIEAVEVDRMSHAYSRDDFANALR